MQSKLYKLNRLNFINICKHYTWYSLLFACMENTLSLSTQGDRIKKNFFLNPLFKHSSLKDSVGGDPGCVPIPILTQNCFLSPGDDLNLSNFLICQKREGKNYH